jgi:hypothetical protein
MNQCIKGIPLGIYPEVGEAKVILKTPDRYFEETNYQLITAAKGTKPNTVLVTMWNWIRDFRFKEVKGTWVPIEMEINKHHLRALKKIEMGEL